MTRPSGNVHHSSNDAPDGAQARQGHKEQQTDDPLAPLLARLHETRQYVGLYVATRLDQVRAKGKTVAMRIAIGLVLACIAVSILVAACVLLVVGLSSGIGQLFAEHAWLGQVIVGSTILAVAIGGSWLLLKLQVRSLRRTLVKNYERRKQAIRTRPDAGSRQANRAEPGNGQP